MWSAINQYNTYYYGANFLSYVGTIPESDKLVMVKPVNGQNYDTFIMSQYFGTTVEGNVAAVEVTLTVITGSKNLPAISKLTLEYADTVSGIRSLYEGLANDQKALVSNYETLLQAEAKINRLTAGTVKPPVEEIDPVEKPENNGVAVWIVILSVLGGMAVGAGACVGVYFIIKRKNKAAPSSNAADKQKK
jgi:hypothetical protein